MDDTERECNIEVFDAIVMVTTFLFCKEVIIELGWMKEEENDDCEEALRRCRVR